VYHKNFLCYITSVRKLFLIFLLSQLLLAGVWQDFNGKYELYAPNGYPPVTVERVREYTALDGSAVKISAPQGPALFIIEGLSNPEDIDTLTFFCRADTVCEMQIALADERKITAFENIQEYLPLKRIDTEWQKAEYPLQNQEINIHDIRKIYVQLTPLENEKTVVYLDDIILEKAEVRRPNYQVVYNFNGTTKNIFNDTPVFDDTAVQLELTGKDCYGASGQSLGIQFTAQKNPTEIFFPMTPAPKQNQLDIKRISFVLRSAEPLTLDFLPETTAIHRSAKYGQPYSGQNFRITFQQPNWQKIVLPLENGEDFYGLRISIPAGSGGVFYLDDLSLN